MLVVARDCMRRFCRDYRGRELHSRVYQITFEFRKQLVQSGDNEDWEREVRDTVKHAVTSPVPPHRCDYPLLERYCPLKKRKTDCPWIAELRAQKARSFQPPSPPENLNDRQARVYLSICWLECICGRQPYSWLVCSQDQIAERAKYSRQTVATVLPELVAKGVVEIQTGSDFKQLIKRGDITSKSARGTAVRRLV